MPAGSAASERILARLGFGPHRPGGQEIRTVLSLFVVGALTGLLYCLFYTGTPQYYQPAFGPAVMFASGHGFVNPDLRQAPPELVEFLEFKRDRLRRDGALANVPTKPFDVYQNGTRYLLIAVGLWWRIAGISWRQVAVVNAVLYGAATIALYAIFRLALPRMWAVFGALVLCFSAVQLENLVHVRDYAKAPFIFAAIALMGRVALGPVSRRRLLSLSGLCGTVLGIGTGFRIDVDVFVPIFGFVVLVFYADRPWQAPRAKLAALGVLVLSFLVCAGPVLAGLSAGTALSHVTLLGLTDPFDAGLQIRPAIYSFGHHYLDEYVRSVVGGYAERIYGVSPVLPSAMYERMGTQYLLTLAAHFPADLLTRFVGSVIGILELPFTAFSNYSVSDRIPLRQTVTPLYLSLRIFDGLGVPLAGLVLGVSAVTGLRVGFFTLCALIMVCGVPSVQFDLRHYFHLQFISIFNVLLLAYLLVLAAGRVRRLAEVPESGARPLRWFHADAFMPGPRAVRAAARLSLMGLVIAAISVVPLSYLRGYQERHLKQLFRDYLAAERQAITPVVRSENGGRVLITWDQAQGRAFGQGRYPTDYYLVELASDDEFAVGEIRLRYRALVAHEDLSQNILVRLRRGITRVFFPVYGVGPRDSSGRFLGLEVTDELRRRLRGVFRVSELKDKPLLLDVQLGPDWERERLGQTLREWEAAASPVNIVSASGSRGSDVLGAWVHRLSSATLQTDDLHIAWTYRPVITTEGRRILGDGRVGAQHHYFVQFKELPIAKGALLVARGRLMRGGLAIGLLKDNRWSRLVRIDAPGEFIAAVEADETGAFVPLISSATAAAWDRSRFIITEIGILNPDDR